MKKIKLETGLKKMLADVYTPVSIYLRLRDRFRDTILLESTDHHAAENSYSFICINAFAGIEISDMEHVEFKYPGELPQRKQITATDQVPAIMNEFMNRFDVELPADSAAKPAQGLYGYTTYDAIRFFEHIPIHQKEHTPLIPLMRYRLYQYVIAINHFKDEMYLCENKVEGIKGDASHIETLIRSKDVPVFPFSVQGNETSDMDDATFINMVKKGIKHCLRGDVFQIVLSRRFHQSYKGDDFNVYRALRSINPSPYLFYFDYGDYHIMGSSPEAQLVIKNGSAVVHPIAGTFKRSGDEIIDKQTADALLLDPKENAEHVMLVDLARNDLSRLCNEVSVTHYRQPQYFSHVIHLVSEVKGELHGNANPFDVLAATFTAGTMSGAPKVNAMELITAFEPNERKCYCG
jgi:anthranilate synthase component 1